MCTLILTFLMSCGRVLWPSGTVFAQLLVGAGFKWSVVIGILLQSTAWYNRVKQRWPCSLSISGDSPSDDTLPYVICFIAGTKKSVEGTLASIVVQIIFVISAFFFGMSENSIFLSFSFFFFLSLFYFFLSKLSFSLY